MVVLLSLVGLCNIFLGKNTMNKNTPMIFDDRQVLLELHPTFSWDSANFTYDARHGIVTPLWYVAMQPGGLASDVGRWVEIRIKKSLGLFLGRVLIYLSLGVSPFLDDWHTNEAFFWNLWLSGLWWCSAHLMLVGLCWPSQFVGPPSKIDSNNFDSWAQAPHMNGPSKDPKMDLSL